MLTGASGVVIAGRGMRIAGRDARVAPADRDLALQPVARFAMPSTPPLEARTEDGYVWRRIWLEPDRLVVDFPDQACVEVRDRDGGIVIDRALPPDMEEHVVLDHVLPLVLARRGDLVLHGAVVHLGSRAAVLTGPTGSGKSTLTAWAAQHGWEVGGDDGGIVHPGLPLRVEPTYPTVRLLPDAAELLELPDGTGTEAAGKRRLGATGSMPFRREPTSLGIVAVVTAVAQGRAATFTRLRGAEAHVALFANTFHAQLGRGSLLSGVVELLADVASTVPVGLLGVPRGRHGLAAAEEVLRQEINRHSGEERR